MFIDHQTGKKVSFKRRSKVPITVANNYGNIASTYGLWDGVGANNAYSYQLLICDTAFFTGFFVSGHTGNCYKQCDSWCGDKASPYFRTASTNANYKGVAFNVNGHYPNIPSNRLISVGLRWDVLEIIKLDLIRAYAWVIENFSNHCWFCNCETTDVRLWSRQKITHSVNILMWLS